MLQIIKIIIVIVGHAKVYKVNAAHWCSARVSWAYNINAVVLFFTTKWRVIPTVVIPPERPIYTFYRRNLISIFVLVKLSAPPC